MPEIEYLTTLTPKQHQALTLLAEGRSVTAVAKTCGLHRTTIQYWKRTNTEFSYALQDASTEHADHWRSASNQRAEAALALIDTILADPKVPASVRLKAALHILNAATAPPPKFEYGRQDDPYRAGHQLLAQMRAGEAAHDQFIRDSFAAKQDAGVAHLPDPQQNSSQFITPNNNEKEHEAEAAPRPGDKQNDSSLFITSGDDEYKVATIRHAQPPTGRNQTCPCKSGKKFKHCCLDKQAA